MRFNSTEIDGLILIELDHRSDERGYFARTFCKKTFAARGLAQSFPQCGTAFNALAGTVRGMHFQAPPHGEAKVIRCTRGAILDVIVDARPGSPTYLKSYQVELREGDGRELYVAEGLAHGYQTLSNETEVFYMMSVDYAPDASRGLRWDDPAISVNWPRPIAMISEKDRTWPLLNR
jgi:dTDP-4-dehydrorhamnose 3,5-epimerase